MLNLSIKSYTQIKPTALSFRGKASEKEQNLYDEIHLLNDESVLRAIVYYKDTFAKMYLQDGKLVKNPYQDDEENRGVFTVHDNDGVLYIADSTTNYYPVIKKIDFNNYLKNAILIRQIERTDAENARFDKAFKHIATLAKKHEKKFSFE